MKKILIATDTFLPKIDGVSIFLTKVIPELEKYYNITLICPKFSGEIVKFNNIKIVRTDVSRIKIANYNISRPKNKIISNLVKDADLVWIQSIGPIGNKTLKYASKFHKKVIAYAHAIEGKRFTVCSETTSRLKLLLSYITKIYERNFYNKCTKIMVSSDSVYKILFEEGIKINKIKIPLGIDSNIFIHGNKEVAKSKLGIDDKFVIGYVGRISKEKNLETLRNAFTRLNIKNKLLLVVGGGSLSQKKIFDKTRDIRITGFVEDVVPYLQAMDVYVLPSLTETSSLSTLEAMSTGLPVVATCVGAIPDYIQNMKNGILFNPRDVANLARILNKLYENNELRKKLGENARKTVSKFSWKDSVDKIREAFDKEL